MSAQTFVLDRGELLKLNASRGATVRVRAGDVWLTQPMDLKDYFLRANHMLVLNGRGRTVITASEPSVLVIYRRNHATMRALVAWWIKRSRSEIIRAVFMQNKFNGRENAMLSVSVSDSRIQAAESCAR